MRLRQTRHGDLCWTRVRAGRGFSFRDEENRTVSEPEQRERLKALAIPPAWTDVVICRFANGHIQARGQDTSGRTQYIYHPDWETRRNARKTEHLQDAISALSQIRARVEKDLGRPKGSRELPLAIAIALMDRTAMRVGLDRHFRTHRTRGAATLLKRDARVSGSKVQLSFKGKGGKSETYSFKHQKIAGAIRRIKTLQGSRLLKFRDDEGDLTPINSEMINAYLRDISGAEISAKDIRLLHASALAGEELSKMKPGASPAARSRQVARVSKKVSKLLHNTPAVSRGSYIAEPILSAFSARRLKRRWDDDGRRKPRLSVAENHLRLFLNGLSQTERTK